MSQAQPNPVGRPSSYVPEVADRILDGLMQGKSLRSVCADPDLPHYVTVLRWVGDPEKSDFAARYAHAREAQAELYADEVVQISDDEEDAQKARNRIGARQWAAEKLKPKKFGNFSRHEISGANGGPIQTQQSDESMIAQLVAVAGQNPMVKHKLRETLKAALAALE